MHELVIFPSQLGWMGVVTEGPTVRQLTFGHRSRAAATAAIDPDLAADAIQGDADAPLVARLQAYAEGVADDFRDVEVDVGRLSGFQRRIIQRCRSVRYGATISYGELAAKAGYPGAARAVGNCMAANRVPLIVPCHRVVHSGGRLGRYSSEGGTEMKQRLLALESAK